MIDVKSAFAARYAIDNPGQRFITGENARPVMWDSRFGPVARGEFQDSFAIRFDPKVDWDYINQFDLNHQEERFAELVDAVLDR